MAKTTGDRPALTRLDVTREGVDVRIGETNVAAAEIGARADDRAGVTTVEVGESAVSVGCREPESIAGSERRQVDASACSNCEAVVGVREVREAEAVGARGSPQRIW